MPSGQRLDDNNRQENENNGKMGSNFFCFGHGVGAHVCGIAGISEERLKEMNVHSHPQVCFRQ